jgi:hypothetical protein
VKICRERKRSVDERGEIKKERYKNEIMTEVTKEEMRKRAKEGNERETKERVEREREHVSFCVSNLL